MCLAIPADAITSVASRLVTQTTLYPLQVGNRMLFHASVILMRTQSILVRPRPGPRRGIECVATSSYQFGTQISESCVADRCLALFLSLWPAPISTVIINKYNFGCVCFCNNGRRRLRSIEFFFIGLTYR